MQRHSLTHSLVTTQQKTTKGKKHEQKNTKYEKTKKYESKRTTAHTQLALVFGLCFGGFAFDFPPPPPDGGGFGEEFAGGGGGTSTFASAVTLPEGAREWGGGVERRSLVQFTIYLYLNLIKVYFLVTDVARRP